MRFLALGLLLTFSGIVHAAMYFVSPSGNDQWAGRQMQPDADGTGPFATVRRALEEVRRVHGLLQPDEDLQIELAGGRYELSEPIELTPEIWDSAGSGRLIIESVANARALVSGGRLLRGWTSDPTNGALWHIQLPELRGAGWTPHQLFLDGRRLQRARMPNTGYFRTAGRLGTNKPIAVPYHEADLGSVKPSPQAWLIMLMKWTDLQFPLRDVDAEHRFINLPGGPRPYWMDEPNARYWVENAPEALDQPGEWIVDSAAGRISLLAPAGVDPNRASVVAAKLPALVRFRGDGTHGKPVRNITIRKIDFSDADYQMPDDGVMDLQAAVNAHGAMVADFARNVGIIDCSISNCGGYGIDLFRGCQSWFVDHNDIHDMGGGGARIGDPNGKSDPPAATGGNVFSYNRMRHLGRVFPPACGVLIFLSAGNTISHNDIFDLYYTGVSVGWTWGYRTNACQGNRIEYNHIYNIGQGVLSDMGGVYTLGPQPGTVVRNNLIHDVDSYDYGGWGLYTDEGSTGIVLENNVVYRCKDAGFHQHYGQDNVIRNNLFAWNRLHSVMRTREEPHRSFWFTNNVVVADSGSLLGSNWKGGKFDSDGNLWFDARLGADASRYRFAGQTWEEWRQRGLDTNSLIADPLLIDKEHPEKGLRPGSPAYGVGFRPIDLANVGVAGGL